MKDSSKEEELVSTTEKRQSLSRCVRLSIFITLILIQGAINISSGLLSSASKEIKTSMKLNDKEYGMFGTSNGLGRIVGSIIYMSIVNSVNRKFTLVMTLLLKGISLYTFSVSDSLWIMIGIRGLLGIEHIPLMIYIPVWIDQFGIQKFKTFFMTLVQVIVPIGKVTGYLLHILFTNAHWKMGFVVEGVILHLSMVFFLFCPAIFFSNKLVVVKDLDGGEHVEKKEMRIVSIFEARQTAKQEKNESFCDEISIILCKPVYVISLLIRAMVFGVNTAIHYWIGDYMRTVLMVDGEKVFGAYTIIAISGPLGGLFAGSIITAILGGYENKHSSLALILSQSLACACGLASPFFNSIYYFCALNTLYFVFNSVAQPLIQGIILTSVSPKNKGTAFSIANFSTMLTTSGPFPFFYGAINDHFKKDYPFMAMFSIMMIATLSILPMIIMSIFRYREFDKKKEPLIPSAEEERNLPTGSGVKDVEMQRR